MRPSLLAVALSGALALGCGARSSLLPGEAESQEPPATTTAPPSCSIDASSRPLPAFSAGALCSAGPDALGGGATMAALSSRTLFALTSQGAAPSYGFFADVPQEGWFESSRQVISRGGWVAAGDVVARFPDAEPGEARAEVVLADRSGKLSFSRSLSGTYKGNFTDLRLTGNDRGIVAYSFVSYPDVHTLEVVSMAGELLASAEGVDPISDPDDRGFVAVRDSTSPDVPTYWLYPCSGELRPTEESKRPARTTVISWGSRLVYTDVGDNTLVVEGPAGGERFDLTEPSGDGYATIFDMHPSGWALVTTQDPLRFEAIHAGTGERRSLHVALPEGFHRYDNYTGAFGPGAFDPVAHELRVTSSGGLILPLRNAAEGFVFTSEDGESWLAAGAPIGNVYTAKAVEAGGTLLHVGNAYAVSLPPWDPAPIAGGRLDYQSTQLIRAASGASLLVEQSPMGQSYNHLYRLSADGGCLATEPILNGDVRWTSAVTGADLTFPLDAPGSLSTALQWAGDGDVTLGSLE